MAWSRFALVGTLWVVSACSFNPSAAPDAVVDIPARVEFQFPQSVTDEMEGVHNVKLVLSRASVEAASVTFALTGGTAIDTGPSPDFTIASGQTGTIDFAPGATSADLPIAIHRDQMEEPDETIKLVLNAAVGADLGIQTTHTVTISANVLPRVQFQLPTSVSTEDVAAGIPITMNTESPIDIVVTYIVTGSAAAVGVPANPLDHNLGTSGMITIPAGSKLVVLDPGVIDDAFDEPDETIDLALAIQSGAIVMGTDHHSRTITDNDAPPTVAFNLAASNVSEAVGTVMLDVSLSSYSGKTVTVNFAGVVGSAGAADATVTAGTLTFPPGTTTLQVPVTIINDVLDENSENFSVVLTGPTNATIGNNGSHVVTILDDDNPPTIDFELPASSVGEATPTHQVVVALSAVSGRDVQFALALGGTATALDFTVSTGPFTIPAGMTTTTINVTILNDTLDEDDETADLTLTSLVNATAGATQIHTITILDNDNPPVVRFDPLTANQSVDENDTGTKTFIYTVILSAPSGRVISVPVSKGGTANNADFVFGTGDIPAVFLPGQISADVRVIVNGDTQTEPNETVIMTLGTPTNATLGVDRIRIHTIQNDD